jgi:hypothetical protein
MTPSSKSRGRIVVGGIFFYFPLAGVAWQHLHYLVGLRRLGWDVTYLEINDWYPYNPRDSYENDDGTHATNIEPVVEWVSSLLERFGFRDHWYYQTGWDGNSFGLDPATARQRLAEADAFINLCGSHHLNDDHLACPRRIYLESDPVGMQIKLLQGDEAARQNLENHTSIFSFGENLGTNICPLPTGGFTWTPTRQPVVVDEWDTELRPASQAAYSTIGNWDAKNKEVVIDGRVYQWQKGIEFLKVRDLPRRVDASFSLAMRFGNAADQILMEEHGWKTSPALDISLDIDTYRTFIQNSRAEFTVAKEQNIVFQTGWFSDRAVTYLASGRPVINQDTGFAHNLPVSEGLFSFRTEDDCVAAVEAIEADYPRHSRVSKEIAREYFAHDRVLPPLLAAAGL